MKYFFVGIKGVGVVGIATLYKEWGHEVIGSDVAEEFFTDEILKKLGISVVSFDISHITADITKLVYSSAYGADHPQVARARELGIAIASYSEALAELFNAKKGIVVTGTHGKTTTSAMLARILEDAGFDPTAVIGGELVEWHRTVRTGSGEWMVVEGDEYQAKILALKPYAVLLTNVEYDHPDFYKNEEEYKNVFRQLIGLVPTDGIVVAHESLRGLVAESSTKVRVIFFSELDASTNLTLWGKHNRENAAGALMLADALGIEQKISIKALTGFRGTKRRMELYTLAEAPVVVLDDYAHHPTEIRATLSALRNHYGNRHIIALFQPHTYSRTKTFLGDFATAFGDSDEVVILDIYSSAREQVGEVTGKNLFEEVAKHHAHTMFAANIDDALTLTREKIKQDCVVVTMGAGDVWRVAQALAGDLQKGS
ncbi:MAG: UDP-N-acetylmuramate--L-alanine ligase [Candidatus Ryanbacteria bacterium]|nr:UDP-N-acetylmuramate--L-alanine ligase [Candidatus Ryanbacteria bacterium]